MSSCSFRRLCRAQEAPEDLLPAGTQVYLRWDGVDAHRDAYAKTAMGQMLAGDTGKFITSVIGLLQDNLGALVTVEQLLKGSSPSRLMKLQTDAAQAPKLIDQLTKHGFILAGDVRKLDPIEAQVRSSSRTPAPNRGRSSVCWVCRRACQEVKPRMKKSMASPCGVGSSRASMSSSWAAGKHMILTVGTDAPADCVKRSTAKDARLSSNPLYQRVHGFNKYETGGRAFLDVESLVKEAKSRGDDVGKLLDDLGLEGVKNVVLYSGFDADAERGLIEAELTGPRKGIVKMLDGKPFTLADAPPLPQDVTSWSMTRFEPTTLYDVALLTAENILKLVSPEDLPKVKELAKQADELLDVEVRDELLASLGDRFAMYTSPGDGPLNLGQVFLFQVKDAAKLQAALNKAIKGAGRLTGTDLGINKRDYHGARAS